VRWSVAVMLLLAIACALLVIALLASGALAPKPTPPRAAGTGSASPAAPAGPQWVGEPDGLQYKDTVVGEGNPAAAGDTVDVLYEGRLTDGTVFDSNQDRETPFSFTLGRGEVIKGWDQGVAGMRVGGKRELKIPPELGYGRAGSGPSIPPGATLEFTVELLAIH
jgi:FKBP-type peptidyl-prolyl cis-trans isomerase